VELDVLTIDTKEEYSYWNLIEIKANLQLIQIVASIELVVCLSKAYKQKNKKEENNYLKLLAFILKRLQIFAI
jgi:hypothetical protein